MLDLVGFGHCSAHGQTFSRHCFNQILHFLYHIWHYLLFCGTLLTEWFLLHEISICCLGNFRQNSKIWLCCFFFKFEFEGSFYYSISRILHPDKLPLEIGEKYWILRDSVQYCELFILRVLDFQVSFDSPQKVCITNNILMLYLH